MSSRRRAQTDLSGGPSRHDSTSTNSSHYSTYSNAYLPGQTSTVSSNSSRLNSPEPHERKAEYSPRIRNSIQMFDRQASPGETYGNIRRSLRPLPQAPNLTPPRPKTSSSHHARSRTIGSPIPQEEYAPEVLSKPSPIQYDRGSSISPDPNQFLNDQQLTPRRRAQHSRTQSSPQAPPLTTAFTTPDLQTFQKSSTRHLRTLSKFVEDESEEFTIANVTPSVVGLHGRRQLKRADSIRPQRLGTSVRRNNGSAWNEITWMDKQRQFIQAYEYLCHIGEAKEWIEDIIHKPIPPIVQLEEALRDGITLAEIVQALYPHRVLRIFRHAKLQYRHSDNIALFFQFLDEVGLPEVFRFELIDLYEKKNIPKVIHCIHALSWLLFKLNIVDFRIGNLVGQLEFEHHELEQTQRGLDRSGVPMPSFSGMGESFGAEPGPEPEPEPVETDEQRIDRELHENETAIEDFQSQVRGALLRLQLGNTVQNLWDSEERLTDLQSRIRGDWARQIFDYRLGMQRFAVNLQSFSRAFLARRRYRNHQQQQQVAEPAMLLFQSLVRAQNLRSEMQFLKSQAQKEESGIKSFQAAIRGALVRKSALDEHEDIQVAGADVQHLQAAVRGMLQRRAFAKTVQDLDNELNSIVDLQAAVRGMWQREASALELQSLSGKTDGITTLQSVIRGMWQRQAFAQDLQSLRAETCRIEYLQAAIRGMWQRQAFSRDVQRLHDEESAITDLQSAIKGVATRRMLKDQEAVLTRHNKSWITLQSSVRGAAVRQFIDAVKAQLEDQVESITESQSAIRGMLLRSTLDAAKLALQDEEESILTLQSFIRGTMLRQRLNKDRDALAKELPLFVDLQALARAAMVRIPIGDLLSQLEACEDEVVELQALTRAMLVRLDVGTLLSDLEAEEEIIIDLQTNARGCIVRDRFAEKLRFYRENMEKVIKVQSFVRGKIQGEAYKSLTSGKNPPVGTIKGFVHLLNDSDFDFDEEIEFERMRKTVVQQVRQNELADQYISQLDIKIALLVKNKITLDEVVKHQKHFGGHVGSLLPNRDMSSKDPFDLKALNKNSRRKLEHYQELFFLLQTQPQYLARVFKRMRELVTSEREYERVKHLVMGLFGYSQKRREEYYLLKLIVRSIKEEVDASAAIHDYVRGNYLWNKLFAAYIKSPRDRKYMRDALGPVVKENIIENPELDLESDPMQIYRSSVNNEELRTGRRSHRRPDVPREEAIRDPETRETFIRHLQDLRDFADQIFSAVEETLHRMPFGVRFITKQIYEYLLSKFEDEDKGYVLQVAGQWVWKNYLHPALMEPEKFGVVDRALTQEQRKNMGEVSKVIAQAVSGRLFGNENVYLQPLNTYVGEAIQRLGHIWANMVTVQDAESYFQIDEFNDLYAKTKPTLYIKMSDIFSIHQLIAAEVSHISADHDDTLKEIVRDLGSVKSNENELMNVSTSEINLTLTPKLHNVDDPDAEVKALFMETKRCILYIIRVQSGADLMHILVSQPTEEDEQRWHTLVRDELSHNSRKRAAYSDANTLTDIGAMNYQELKRTALENIVHLEQAGRISRRNNYQDILNDIALDIRTKHRRRIQRERELENIRLTLDRIHDQAVYLDQQLKTYNDYIEQAMVTLQNKKGKKRFLMPFTKQWDHQRELQRTGRHFKFGSYKYSARNLADKGVLVHWKGYTERQWDRVDLTISSNEVGVFMIDGSSGNMMVPGANAQIPLDDLLQAQFNNTQFMDLFEGQLRVNVNLFLHLIMRKFYNE